MVSLFTLFLCEIAFKYLLGSDGGIGKGFEPLSSLSTEGLYKRSHDHIQLFHVYVPGKSTEGFNVTMCRVIIFPIEPMQML